MVPFVRGGGARCPDGLNPFRSSARRRACLRRSACRGRARHAVDLPITTLHVVLNQPQDGAVCPRRIAAVDQLASGWSRWHSCRQSARRAADELRVSGQRRRFRRRWSPWLKVARRHSANLRQGPRSPAAPAPDGGWRLFVLEHQRCAQDGATEPEPRADVAPTITILRAPSFRQTGGCSGRCGQCPPLATSCTAVKTVGLACQLKGAAVGRVQTGDHVEERGLARANWDRPIAIDLTAWMVMPTSDRACKP